MNKHTEPNLKMESLQISLIEAIDHLIETLQYFEEGQTDLAQLLCTDYERGKTAYMILYYFSKNPDVIQMPPQIADVTEDLVELTRTKINQLFKLVSFVVMFEGSEEKAEKQLRESLESPTFSLEYLKEAQGLVNGKEIEQSPN